jgi:hypothetical protein
MSSDPTGFPPDQPYRDPSSPYDQGLPPPDPRQVRERVQLPAIFLIIIGVLNLLLGLWVVGNSSIAAFMRPDEFEKLLTQDSNQAKQMAELKKQGFSPQDIQKMVLSFGVGGGSVAIIASLLIITGGVCMLALKWYGLAIFASVLAAIPCISPSGCCLLGEGIGIWSLVVLLNNEIRQAFR